MFIFYHYILVTDYPSLSYLHSHNQTMANMHGRNFLKWPLEEIFIYLTLLILSMTVCYKSWSIGLNYFRNRWTGSISMAIWGIREVCGLHPIQIGAFPLLSRLV